MSTTRLEQLLEYPERAPFYDLLGGLADNLLTIGPYAGTFLACGSCGHTFTLKGESWQCESCGQGFEVKFAPAKQQGMRFDSAVKVTGLTKPCCNPHWYYENENWSVAEFLMQILRLRPEEFLGPWVRKLGVGIDPGSALETVLCWPRFRFGGKTVQPDLAIGFHRDIVLIEFKRPVGGVTPPVEIMGQLCFAADAARQLGRQWHLLLVPGKNAAARAPADYVREAMAAVAKATAKWSIPPAALTDILSVPLPAVAGQVQVFGWEDLLQQTLEAIRAHVPESWSQRQALAKLRFFQASRASLDLLAPPVG